MCILCVYISLKRKKIILLNLCIGRVTILWLYAKLAALNQMLIHFLDGTILMSDEISFFEQFSYLYHFQDKIHRRISETIFSNSTSFPLINWISIGNLKYVKIFDTTHFEGFYYVLYWNFTKEKRKMECMRRVNI